MESESKKDEIVKRVNDDKAKLETKIEAVCSTVNALVEKLSTIENLPTVLTDNDFDSLNNSYYFSDFVVDKGDGYVRNNFGQDWAKMA